MKKNSWIYITLGLVGVGLFFAYKKRNTPPPSPNTGEGTNSGIASSDVKKRKDLTIGEMQFSGSGIRSNSQPIYAQLTNLIPDVYGQYHNADGGKEYISTKNIECACKSANARKNIPSPIFNVYA
jgi:hypothetical protein